jgi:hypothetical protein
MLKRQTARICRVEPWWSVVLGVSTTPSAPSERCTSQPVYGHVTFVHRHPRLGTRLFSHGCKLLLLLLLLFNTTRTLPGPPSTGAAIAMEGGVADTACYCTGR